MNPQSLTTEGETLSQAALRIRSIRPIRGATATDEDCAVRDRLCGETLDAHGIILGVRHWYTAQLATGRVVGVFAHAPEQAELTLSVWWAADCEWVREDDQTRLYRAYFPRGKRSAVEADRTFPVGPPRTPPDEFAPTPSLLAGLTDAGGRVLS